MNKSHPESLRVLAVDDEEVMLNLYQDILCPETSHLESESGLETLEARLFGKDSSHYSTPSFQTEVCYQGDQAVEAVRRAVAEGRPFALAFIDIRMPPGPDGVWAAGQIRKQDPHIELVMVTGYSDIDPQDLAQRIPPRDKLLYIQKPFHPQEIRQFASALGAKWVAERELRTIHAALEIQVKERTAELAEMNEQLNQEIMVRRRAEKELQHTLGKLRKAMDGIIEAMALTVERRDPYTAGHQRRVTNLARAIATEMELRQEQIDGIRMAGVIHDIGKISIPAEILSKPGKLTETEFSLIKTHPVVGYDILKNIEFEWPVAQIVYQHHEKMDGSGYPLGLTGKDLLMESKILGVADVVEAMASHRPYRPGLGIDKALEEVSQKRDILYDPQVVDACLRVFKEKGFRLESF